MACALEYSFYGIHSNVTIRFVCYYYLLKIEAIQICRKVYYTQTGTKSKRLKVFVDADKVILFKYRMPVAGGLEHFLYYTIYTFLNQNLIERLDIISNQICSQRAAAY